MRDNENIKTRKVETEVRGTKVIFDEYYKIDKKTGEEIFDRDLEIKNDLIVYDMYKKQKGLLTTSEIKEIRKKYEMNQKEYAFVIGVGEVTVNRFENGSIQTEATDAIMRLSNDPDNMYNLLEKNKINIPEKIYEIFLRRVNELKTLKLHRIAKYNKEEMLSLDFKTLDVFAVADNVIKKYNKQYELLNKQYKVDTNCEYITPLKLQKLLYYIQGMALCIYGFPAFTNKIYAWDYGPVIDDIYHKYKIKGKMPIDTPKNVKKISKGLSNIIDIVIDSYGRYNAGSLIDLTHEESPWKDTEKDKEITIDKIEEYFNKVYDN